MTRHVAPRSEALTGAEGNKLAADVYGTGDHVVALLHGGGQTRHAWRRTAETMAQAGMIAYAIDQRGHGDSEWVPSGAYEFQDFAADAREIAHQLAARHGQRAIMAGASLGGVASMTAEGMAAPQIAPKDRAKAHAAVAMATSDSGTGAWTAGRVAVRERPPPSPART